jgi:ADP-heptose:LPS heptosyltransferase
VKVWRPIWQDVGNHMPFDPVREFAFIRSLAARHFDAALVFSSFSQNPHVPAYACYLAGIPLRAGESKEFGGSTLSSELRGASDELHQAERNLRLVEQVGFTVSDRRLSARITEGQRTAMRATIAAHGVDPSAPYIVLPPGASAQARRYPADRFGVVASELCGRGWSVIVPGVAREQALINIVLEAAPDAVPLVDALELPEYAALIDGAALVICNDTLAMHLADAVATPAVVLYSGTEYESQWRPRATPHALLRIPTPCSPCYRFECPIGLPCLDIAPEAVVRAALHLLAAKGETSVPSAHALTGGAR